MHQPKGTIIIALLFLMLPCAGPLQAQGVAKNPMRKLSAKDLVFDMKIGWNLGNTLDATTGGETGWGNPKTTQAMMDAVKKMGFKTVRIPVTWQGHMGGAPNYTIDKAWLDRVEEIANYVLRNSMYAIINSHHDEWVTLSASSQTTVADRLGKLWAQIAARFKNYSDYLVFETLNEPRQSVNEWNGGTPEARSILNTYHLSAVNAIRATGGNNATRLIMICGHGATPTTECVRDIAIPNDDPNCVISLHTYYPQDFSFEGNTSTWGSDTDKKNVISELDRENKDVALKGGGTAIIGEWGSINKNNLSSRVAHAEFYAREALSRGMLPIWWDNGANDFVLLNRKSNPPSWTWPTIAEALVRGANDAEKPVRTAPAKTTRVQPAPFTERAGRITYTLSAPAAISLCLYSMRGSLITTLVSSIQSAGKYSVCLPQRISTGSYLIEMKTGPLVAAKKVTLVGERARFSQ